MRFGLRNISLKKRTKNFATEEIITLINIVANYRDILEKKKTDSNTIREKYLTWERIAQEFNVITTGSDRTHDQLRQKYENLKKESRRYALQKNDPLAPRMKPNKIYESVIANILKDCDSDNNVDTKPSLRGLLEPRVSNGVESRLSEPRVIEVIEVQPNISSRQVEAVNLESSVDTKEHSVLLTDCAKNVNNITQKTKRTRRKRQYVRFVPTKELIAVQKRLLIAEFRANQKRKKFLFCLRRRNLLLEREKIMLDIKLAKAKIKRVESQFQ